MSIPALILAVSSVVAIQATPDPATAPPAQPVSPSGVPIKPPARERQVRNEEIYKPSSVKARSPELEGTPAADATPSTDAATAPAPDAAPAAPAPAATPAAPAPAAPARAAPVAPAPTSSLGPSEFAVLGVLAIIVLAPMVLGVWWIVSSRADSSSSHSI